MKGVLEPDRTPFIGWLDATVAGSAPADPAEQEQRSPGHTGADRHQRSWRPGRGPRPGAAAHPGGGRSCPRAGRGVKVRSISMCGTQQAAIQLYRSLRLHEIGRHPEIRQGRRANMSGGLYFWKALDVATPNRMNAMILFNAAIDLKGGQCVRLKQGDMDRATVFNADPADQARQFGRVAASGRSRRRLRRRAGGQCAGGRGDPEGGEDPGSARRRHPQPAADRGMAEEGRRARHPRHRALKNPDGRPHVQALSRPIAVGIDARAARSRSKAGPRQKSRSSDLARQFEDAGLPRTIYYGYRPRRLKGVVEARGGRATLDPGQPGRRNPRWDIDALPQSTRLAATARQGIVWRRFRSLWRTASTTAASRSLKASAGEIV